MKTCTKCNIKKDESDFVYKNKSKGVRQSICKECQKSYKLKHYYKNKDAHYKRNKITEDKLKKYADDIKMKGCTLCDEKEISCMDFHHLRDKSDVVAKIIKQGSIKKLKEEIEKCVVLCANCHRKLHAGIIKYPVA